MRHRERLLTSAEAARVLGVGVSAVKRWADEGALACVRTPGRHRRFRQSDLERAQRADLTAEADPWREWLEPLLHAADPYATLARLFRERADTGAWCHVADRLGSLLQVVGDRWQRGEISVSDEHLVSAALQRALTIVVEAIAVPQDAPRCLVATAEGEQHTLGLSLAELCLREAGWRVLWVGAHTRPADVVEQVRKGGVQMVALSASAFSTDHRGLRQQITRVGAVCQRYDVPLVLGGAGAWPDPPPFGRRLHHWADFSELLRPG